MDLKQTQEMIFGSSSLARTQNLGWVIVTADIAILKNPHERQALEKSGCTIFVFKNPYQTSKRWDQFKQLVNVWPKIRELAKVNSRRTVFEVPFRGTEIKRIP
jgi:hypothetical protein